MKKLKIIIILFVFIFLLFFSTFLVFPSEISYNSNVPVTLNEVLRKYGPLYIGFFPLKQAEIKRTFFHLDINYIEPTSVVVKFKNGIFGILSNESSITVTHSSFGNNVVGLQEIATEAGHFIKVLGGGSKLVDFRTHEYAAINVSGFVQILIRVLAVVL